MMHRSIAEVSVLKESSKTSLTRITSVDGVTWDVSAGKDGPEADLGGAVVDAVDGVCVERTESL